MLNWFIKLAKGLLKSINKTNNNSFFNKRQKLLFLRFLKRKKRVAARVKEEVIKEVSSKKKREKKVKARKVYDVKWFLHDNAYMTNNKALAKYKAPKKLTKAQAAKYERFAKNARATLQKALQRQMRGAKLGKRQEEALDLFRQLELASRLDEKSNNRFWFFNFQSTYLKNGVYDTWTKICYLNMKNKANKTYSFFNVPKTKMVALIVADSSGEYMWDYFGSHYSINKKRWIRR